MRILFTVLLCTLMGCSSTPDKPDPPTVIHTPDRLIKAVCVGIQNIDPNKYGGWDGYAPGTEYDATSFSAKFASLGIETTTILTKQATKDNIFTALKDAMLSMKSGDLLIVTLSGHGGQTYGSIDESDGLDEYVCAYDGPILDNTINEWLHYVPKGVCVLWICDTCHSGTMHRTAHPSVVFHSRSIPKTFQGQLILLSGSTESTSSYGSLFGGVWTQNLVRTGPDGVTPKQWFETAKGFVTGQDPQYVEYGNVTNLFRNGIIIPKQGD